MVHRVVCRVGSEQALDFWDERLAAEGAEVEREDGLTGAELEMLGDVFGRLANEIDAGV